ncbi:MAG: AI-2E family transporter [Actinomycetota bacterium]
MKLGEWIGLLALVISLYILWRIRQVVLLVFAAIVLAIALNQIVRLLQLARIKRGIAIFLSVITLLGLVACFIAIVVPPLVNQLQELTDLAPKGLERLRTWSKGLETVIPPDLLVEVRSLRTLTQNFQAVAPRLFGNFFTLFSSSLAGALNLLLVLVLAIMLLADPDLYRRGFICLFPSFYRRRIDEVLSQCERSLIGWVKGTLFDMTVIGVVSGIGLWVLKVPLPLTNAFIAGLLEFIPNLGPTLSIIPPTLLALLDSPWKAGAVIVLYLFIQQLEGAILVPIVMHKAVAIAPAITLLSVLVFSIFFGFLGLLLSVPLAIVIQTSVKELLVKDVFNEWHKDLGVPVKEVVEVKNPELLEVKDREQEPEPPSPPEHE